MTSIFLKDGSLLYYREVGEGRPILFVPGWCMTSEMFEGNLKRLSSDFRCLAIDPRGQGLSSKSSGGNHYDQHAEDLRDFIEQLDLEDIVLVVWSAAIFTGYLYLNKFGRDKISAFIVLDQSPKTLIEDSEDWGEGPLKELLALNVAVSRGELKNVMMEYASHMVDRALTPSEKFWIVDQALQTPADIAALLLNDAIFSDVSGIAKSFDGALPTLYFVSTDKADNAKEWFRKYLPRANVEVLGSHMMFWEYPDQFNETLLNFINK